MSSPHGNPPLSLGAMAAGLLLGSWLLACDAWLKLLSRTGTCDAVETIGDATAELFSAPAGCQSLELGLGLALHPGSRVGISPLQIGLPPALGAVWGLALLAIATVFSVLILRWRWRISGDALALGTFWAGAIALGVPRMIGDGATLTEITAGSLAFGIGDFAIAWSLGWLAWRLVAELRA